MKVIIIVLSGLFALLPVKVPDNEKKQVKNEVVTIGPIPANNFLDINVNPQKLSELSKMRKYDIKIFNPNGNIVYSTTKEVSKFSVFTGGFPEGNYTLTLKVDTIQVRKDFSVKH